MSPGPFVGPVPSRPRRRAERRLTAVIAGAAGVAALALAGSAAGAPSTAPANGGFAVDAAGWAESGACTNTLGLLCTVPNRHRSDLGNTPGSIEAGFDNPVNVASEGSSAWVSPSFSYRGGPATSLSFAYDRRADVAGLLSLGGDARAEVDLIDATAGTRTEIVPLQALTPATGFTTVSASVAPGVLVNGHAYRLELTTVFRNLAAVVTRATVGYDNVRLTSDGAGAFDLGDLSDGRAFLGAGGLGACGLKAVAPPAAKKKSASGTVTLSAKQLRINQRISQAGVRRVNTIADKLTAGLTAADFRDCSLGMKEFSSQAVTGAQNGGVAIPPAGAVASARTTPERATRSSKSGTVTLTAKQLRINQRISQAAVLRVNAISKRMSNGLTAGDLRNGTLGGATLDTSLRRTFARGVPGDDVSTAPVKLKVERKVASGSGTVTLSIKQLRINQRISQAAVRRINHLKAEMAAGLTGANVKDGSLARVTLTPPLQTGGGG